MINNVKVVKTIAVKRYNSDDYTYFEDSNDATVYYCMQRILAWRHSAFTSIEEEMKRFKKMVRRTKPIFEKLLEN